MQTTKQFFLFDCPAEVVIRVKHDNGTTIEVPISDVTNYITGPGVTELRIPMRGRLFDKLVETHDFSSLKRG